MEKFSDEQCKDAEEFSIFYFDLIDNHSETVNYYLSDGAVLDWFGKTIKGIDKITEFFKLQMGKVKHNFSNIEPCHKIGYRDSHIVEFSSTSRGEEIKHDLDVKPDDVSQEKTPPNNTIPSSSRKREKGQGDGLHNCSTDSTSPAKRTRIAGDVVIEAPITTPINIFNISSTGHVEFHAKSTKKYQKETKWSRPCKLQVAYSKTPTGYLIHLIIYRGNMRCRRNLLKEFEAIGAVD